MSATTRRENRPVSKTRHAVYSCRMPQSDDLVSTGEAAGILGVSPRQVVRWANVGTLPPAFRGHGVTGAFVFHREDVHTLAERRRTGAA